jgi:hypothetical protein
MLLISPGRAINNSPPRISRESVTTPDAMMRDEDVIDLPPTTEMSSFFEIMQGMNILDE